MRFHHAQFYSSKKTFSCPDIQHYIYKAFFEKNIEALPLQTYNFVSFRGKTSFEIALNIPT
jgi:hypothetical protein